MSSDELNFDILLNTPTSMEEDVLDIPTDTQLSGMESEDPPRGDSNQVSNSQPIAMTNERPPAPADDPPSKRQAIEPEPTKGSSKGKPKQEVSAPSGSRFMTRLLAINQTGSKRGRRVHPAEVRERPTQPDHHVNRPRPRESSVQRARPTASREPSDPEERPVTSMASILQGREDLLQLATRALTEQTAYPLLHAYLSHGNVARSPREATIQGIWAIGRPKISQIVFNCTYNKDAVPQYTRAYEVPLISPRTMELVLHKLTEGSEVILSLLYSLYAERVLITPATANFMLLGRHVIQRDSSFYHLSYPSVEEKSIGREEALIYPRRVDIRRSPAGYVLQVCLRLHGPIHSCKNTDSDLRQSVEFLMWNAADKAKHTTNLRTILNE